MKYVYVIIGLKVRLIVKKNKFEIRMNIYSKSFMEFEYIDVRYC